MGRQKVDIYPKESYEGLTKGGEQKAIRAHLMMMLEAMQYKGPIKSLTNDSLRQLVEEQKMVYLRKLQKAVEKEHEERFGEALHDRPIPTA
jgi:hypothetical protein